MSKGSKKKETRAQKRRNQARKSRQTGYIVLGIVIVAIIGISAAVLLHGSSRSSTSSTNASVSTTISNPSKKPLILYVNQGNALVDRSNFTNLLSFAKSQQFNTIFFQIYRSGQLLFSEDNLSYFVETAHLEGISLFFSLYFTNSSEQIPSFIYGLGENGINLDMSTLPDSAQNSLLSTLQLDFRNGTTSVTTTNLTSTLKPDLLILETYDFQSDQQYIHPGIIAAIEPLAISSAQEYEQEVEYALSNSSGAMVFDYYGLLQTHY
jgi:hypothetical protein